MTMKSAPDLIKNIINRGKVSSDDVQRLRQEIWSDGKVSANEVEWMFRIEEAGEATDDAWPVLFVEAVTDALVHDVDPAGYIDHHEAQWLINRISRDGIIGTRTELELLIKVMEVATSVPDSLASFALNQVANAVIAGEGPIADGGRLQPGRITASDVELLRRILYARAGVGTTSVSRAEAEVLFDLNHKTIEGDNDPAWSDLFVRCMANHILAGAGYTPPSRDDALRRSAWLDERSEGVWSAFGGFGRQILKGGLKAALSDYSFSGAMERRNEAIKAELSETEKVTSAEADWLLDMFARDRRVCDNERALIEFLSDEAVLMDHRLTRLLDAA